MAFLENIITSHWPLL